MKPRLVRFGALVLLLVAVSVPVLIKRMHDRERTLCIMHLRNVHIALRSAAGMEGISPGRPIPGGVRSLLLRRFYKELPTCPSGGTYSFWSDSSYNGNKDVTCSLAHSRGHDWPGEGPVPPPP